MYFHVMILVALSAGALAREKGHLYLTAFASTDDTCAGTAAGNNVTISADLPTVPNGAGLSDCVAYAPDHGQNVQFGSQAANFTF